MACFPRLCNSEKIQMTRHRNGNGRSRTTTNRENNYKRPTWNDLVRIEKRRRSVLRWTELPYPRILFCWDGTVLSILFTDPLFLIAMTIYVVARLYIRYDLLTASSSSSPMEAANESLKSIMRWLLIVLVFFVVQNYSRLNSQYRHSMGCKGRILNVATMARAKLPQENSRRMIRYMNAAHIAGYVGLSECYTKKNFFDKLNNLYGLVTERECEFMAQINMNDGPSIAFELITWAMMEVEKMEEAERIDTRHATLFRDNILKFRNHICVICDYNDQPIPFFYIHFVSIMSAFYLPYYALDAAYSLGRDNGELSWTKDVLRGINVLQLAMFIVGLRLLGQKMSKPYGSDMEDLSVFHYCELTWVLSNRILEARSPDHFDSFCSSKESQIVNQSCPIGSAWRDEFDCEMSRSQDPVDIDWYDAKDPHI